MSGIPVSAWGPGLALLMAPLAVVGWVTCWHSEESRAVLRRASTIDADQPVVVVDATRLSRLPPSPPNPSAAGDTGQVRHNGANTGKAAAGRSEQFDADSLAQRLAIRRDELLLAGRLERFDENRDRYDERYSRFEAERRVITSERAEQDLAQMFVTHEVSDLLAGVDCRETLCRLTVESSEDSVATILRMRGVLTPLGKDRALRGEPAQGATGTRYVIYVQHGQDPHSG